MPDLSRRLEGRSGTVLLLGVLTPLVLLAALWVALRTDDDGPEGYVPPYTPPQAAGEGEPGVATLPERRREQYVDFTRRAVGAILSGDDAAVRAVTTPELATVLGDLPLGAADVTVRAVGLAGGTRAEAELLVLLGGRSAAPVLVTVDAAGDRLRVSDVVTELPALTGAAAVGDLEAEPAHRRALVAAARVVDARGAGDVRAAGLATYARDRVRAVVAAQATAGGSSGTVGLVVDLERVNGRWRGVGVEVVR
ncbi:hypothetical protein QWY28_08090 [Nocardioides sp. SOB77]|uniref:Uncharacterized protein n=1 Tax=Nocardioides oceani TaxID=3058369 RepID=A0ABT8FEK8_9ACTN|nr:hypothetical protein [Nocardioides oceani]MDN4172895.1 hypothetical protein [Nocardioides oceani]